MKLEAPFTPLVILGGWNRHIFTQDWVKRYLFPEDQEFEIDMLVPQDFNAKFIYTRISSNDIKILLSENILKFNLVEIKYENFDRIEELALQLADYLPHTPVTAYGVNFIFTENKISKDLINLVRPSDLENIKHFTSEKYIRGFVLNDLKFNTTLILSDDKVTFELNFHFNISDLVAFKTSISETPILKLKEEAIKFIKQTYSLEFEGEEI